MILAVDIGNTSVKIASFISGRLTARLAIPTRLDLDATDIKARLEQAIPGPIDGVIISSVVPGLNETFARAILRRAPEPPLFVTAADDLGLTSQYRTDEIGVDRLVNCSAAAEKYGVPCIVISFGTATTIDAISRDREHCGGLISPGPLTAARALSSATARLPEIPLEIPSAVIGTSTATSIQAGIFFGQIGLVEFASRQIKSAIGADAKVVATGGFAKLIAKACSEIDVVDEDLTLEGLYMLYSRRIAARK